MEEYVPLLDLELAKRIADKLALLLGRYAPEAGPRPEDPSAAGEFAKTLRRRDLREVIYLPELAAEPRWPEELYRAADANQERVLVRVSTTRDRMEWACAIFHGSLVYWEQVTADVEGKVAFSSMDPDAAWAAKLEEPEKVLREKGLTLIPPAAMRLAWGRWLLRDLLDPRRGTMSEVGQEVERMAASLLKTRGTQTPNRAYQRVLEILRLGYDPGTLAAALDGRIPESLVELNRWLEERNPPYAWTRDRD